MAREMTRAEMRTKLEKANALYEARGAEIVELNKKLANVQRTLTMKTSEVENLKKDVKRLESENSHFIASTTKNAEKISDLQKENERLEKSNNQFAEMYKEEYNKFTKMAWEAAGWKTQVEYLLEGGIFRFLREKYLYFHGGKESNGDTQQEQNDSAGNVCHE